MYYAMESQKKHIATDLTSYDFDGTGFCHSTSAPGQATASLRAGRIIYGNDETAPLRSDTAHYKWLRLQAPNASRAREVIHMYICIRALCRLLSFSPVIENRTNPQSLCQMGGSCTMELRYAR